MEKNVPLNQIGGSVNNGDLNEIQISASIFNVTFVAVLTSQFFRGEKQVEQEPSPPS
jgi:hypothetical protein